MAQNYPIQIDPIYGCWLWQGYVRPDGYGLTSKWGKMAHRDVYEAEHEPIPEGLYLDHLCRRRHCVNPRHLEPVTRSENEKRKSWRRRSKATTCPRGHNITVNFALTPEGGKVCRQCGKL